MKQAFIYKFCQAVKNISNIRQFHIFFQSNSRRILAIWPNSAHSRVVTVGPDIQVVRLRNGGSQKW